MATSPPTDDNGLPPAIQLADAKRRAEQISINFYFLLEKIDAMHALLCPDQNGTWQNRADQVVAAVKALKRNQ